MAGKPVGHPRVRFTGTITKMKDNHCPLNEEEYEYIYSKVPRLTVEIIVRDESGAVYMTKRSIEPCIEQWHLPGGTVQFGEALIDAVRRVAMRELSIYVRDASNRGYIEYPSHYSKGLDSPVGLVFEVTDYSGDLAANSEASDSGWFTKPPPKMHADQDRFLLDKGYLVA
jgi:ADP-ribose pyrophosphatase YjhB (NUDIX family)